MGIVRSANGTYTEYIEALGDETIYFDGIVSFTGSIDNVSVKEVQGFTSPDGTNNAYKLVEDTNNGQHQIFPTSSTGTNAVRTISFFVKMDGVSKIGIRNNDGKYITYDIVNNTTLDKTITNDFVSSDFNNGWKKLSITWYSTTVLTGARIFLLNDAYTSGNPLTYSYIGDGTSGIYLFGAQAEEGSYSTSLINTQGSAVTKLADECNNGANDQVINSTEGVLYAEISGDDEGFGRSISISDSSINNSVEILYSGSNSLGFRIRANNVVEYSQFFSLMDITQFVKVAISYKSGDIKCFVNGSERNASTETFSFTSPLLELAFDRGNNSSKFYGNVKDLKVYNTALTDQELQALTQV